MKANLVNEEFHDYLVGIAELRKLRIRELEGYMVINGY